MTLDPTVLVLLAAALVVYVRRWRAARAEAGPRGAGGWRLASFCAGVAMLFLALVWPLDHLAGELFVMHMAQHILIVDFASILMILGLTRVILRPVTRRVAHLERAAGPFGHPGFAVVAYAGGLWIWHIPAVYDAALHHPALHALEHTTFAVVGALYWWHLLSPIRLRHRLAGVGLVVYMVSTKVAVGMLGILLTFSPDALYSYYSHGPRHWGLSAVTDQNIGGALMAIEQSVVMGIALAVIFSRMLTEAERDQRRAERYAA